MDMPLAPCDTNPSDKAILKARELQQLWSVVDIMPPGVHFVRLAEDAPDQTGTDQMYLIRELKMAKSDDRDKIGDANFGRCYAPSCIDTSEASLRPSDQGLS